MLRMENQIQLEKCEKGNVKKNVEIKIRKHGAPGRFCVLWLRRVVLALGLVAHAFSPNTPETEAGIIPWALGQRAIKSDLVSKEKQSGLHLPISPLIGT